MPTPDPSEPSRTVRIAVGAIAPIARIPIIGSLNYFSNGRGDRTAILALGGIILVTVGKYRALWLTSLGRLVVMVFTCVNFLTRTAESHARMDADFAGNPFRGLADAAAEAVQLQRDRTIPPDCVALLVGVAAMNPEAAAQNGVE